MFRATLLCLFTTFAAFVFADCPQSSPELMRHFGRTLLKADMLAQRGRAAAVDISDQEIEAAIVGIDQAIICGELATRDCGESLLPPAHREDPAAYRGFMFEFISQLRDYKRLFEEQLISASRDFQAIWIKKQEIQAVVNRAHQEL